MLMAGVIMVTGWCHGASYPSWGWRAQGTDKPNMGLPSLLQTSSGYQIPLSTHTFPLGPLLSPSQASVPGET